MQERYLKEYLSFVVACISAELTNELLKNNFKIDGGVFSCKLDYRFNSQAGAIFKAYGSERLNTYLNKYGITVTEDGKVSKIITKEEIEKSFETAKKHSKEIISTFNQNGGYVFRKFKDDRHIYSVQNSMKEELSNRELTKEEVDKILIDEATLEVQTYAIDAPQKACQEYLEYLETKISDDKNFGQEKIYYTSYSAANSRNGGWYLNEGTQIPNKDYDKGYLKFISMGGNIEKFIEYAKEKGYDIKISKHSQAEYILITRTKEKDYGQVQEEFMEAKKEQEKKDREQLYQKIGTLSKKNEQAKSLPSSGNPFVEWDQLSEEYEQGYNMGRRGL